MSRREALLLAIIFFITVITWVGMGVYRAKNQTTITPIQKEEIKPLNPKFDMGTIESLKIKE